MPVDLEIVTLADRPDLAPVLAFEGGWPEFMLHDPVSGLYYNDAHEAYPEFVLVAIDGDAPDRPAAKAYSVPFSWPFDELPAGGWDTVVLRSVRSRWSTDQADNADQADQVSAIEINVQPDLRGRGLSGVMLDAMRRNAARLGFRALVAPVRPNGKHRHPELPMDEYVRRTRDDGLPVDPWLRVHVRAGGRVDKVAHRSMTIPGTLDEWREWTGLPFDTTGPVLVPEALAPVHCDVAQNHAVYVEPNVWVRHDLAP